MIPQDPSRVFDVRHSSAHRELEDAIRVGEITVTFHKTRHETSNVLEMCELTMPPTGKSVMPHLHREEDLIVLGMNGISTWTVGDETIEVHPGGRLMIPRGVSHSMTNMHETTTRMICLYTPGIMGPEFFREIGQHFHDDVPDVAAVGEILNRYGIIPV